MSRGGREIASEKDSSAPRSRKLRPEVVVGDEKLIRFMFRSFRLNRNARNKKGKKNQNLQGKRQRECSLTKLVASRKKRNCVGKKTDSSDPCSRKLRPDVVGDEKLKTLPKKNQNERTKKGREKKEKESARKAKRVLAFASRKTRNSSEPHQFRRSSREEAASIPTTSFEGCDNDLR